MDCLKQLGWSEQDRHVRLSQFLDGELPASEAEELDEHLKDCPACRELLAGLRGADRHVARSMDGSIASQGFVARVMSALGGRTVSSRVSGRPGPSRALWVVVSVAGLGLLVGAVMLVSHVVRAPALLSRGIGLTVHHAGGASPWESRLDRLRSWSPMSDGAEVVASSALRTPNGAAGAYLVRPDGLRIHAAPGTELSVDDDASSEYGVRLVRGRLVVAGDASTGPVELAGAAGARIACGPGATVAFVEVDGEATSLSALDGRVSLAGSWGSAALARHDFARASSAGPPQLTSRHDVRALPLDFAPVHVRVSPWAQDGGLPGRPGLTPFSISVRKLPPFRIERAADVSAPAIGLDGTVYVLAGPPPGRLIGVRSGAIVVDLALTSPRVGAPAIMPDGRAIVATRSCVVAFDPAREQPELVRLVALDKDASPTEGPTLGLNGTFFITYSRGLSAHEADGTLRWRRGDIVAGAAPSSGPDGTLYVATVAGRLAALDPADGSDIPSTATPVDEALLTHPVVASDGTAYAVSSSRYLVWRTPDGRSGRASLPEAKYALPPALTARDEIVVVSHAGTLYRLPQRPTEPPAAPYFETGETVVRGPTVDAAGRIALWTAAGSVVIVDADGRSGVTNLNARQPSPAAVGRDGALIFGTNDGLLFGM